jgi:hypothetical protein
MPQGVHRLTPPNPRLVTPLGEVELDLACTEATAGLGGEEGDVAATLAVCRDLFEVAA